MEKNFKSTHGGMIVFLCVAVIALWLTAVYGTYEDNQREKYEVRIKPGAVSYGTHSSVTMPAMTAQVRRSSVPMVSGSAVRSYAHHGHAAMPSAGVSSGYRMHTTSSASVKTIGSGSGGGAAMGASSGASSSSRGITYGGGSVSMPVMAVNNSLLATSSVSATEASMPSRLRRARKAVVDDSDGEPGERREDDLDPSIWWYWNEDVGWVSGNDIPVGTLWNDGGVMKRWNGSAWVVEGSHVSDPTNVPLGATPWLLMMLLACAYALYKYYTYKVYKSK